MGCTAKLETRDSDVDETEEPSPITWEECSYNLGDHACDFTLSDKDGVEHNLYDMYGKTILIDLSTMWCGYCQVAAAASEEIYDDYKAKGFLWVSILFDDPTGQAVDASDLQLWVDNFNLDDTITLAGDRDLIDYTAQTGFPASSWPTFILLDDDLVVKFGQHGWNESMIRSAIESELLE